MSLSVVRGLSRPLYHFVFWTWNVLLGTVVYFGLVPALFTDSFLRDVADWPGSFLAFLALLVLAPITALTIGIFRLRKDATKLIRLFYGVEAPLFVLALIRIFAFRQLTPATGWLFGALVLGAIAHGVLLLVGPERRITRDALLVGQTAGVLIAAYVAVVLMFFVAPATVEICRSLFEGGFIRDLVFARSFLALVGAMLFMFSATLFVALPFAFILSHIAGLKELVRAAILDGRGVRALVTVALTTVLGGGITTYLVDEGAKTPETLTRLAELPTSDAERRDRLDDAATIRDRLVDAHLWRYRYLAANGEVREIRRMYEDTLPYGARHLAPDVQAAFEDVVSPFLYPGTRDDVRDAELRYAEFFDESIQRGARAQLKDAVNATFERVDVAANLLDVDERAVHLVEQTITVNPDDFAADVEIFEVYENRTKQDVEILYTFTLPDTAVITGLWLNELAPDKDNAFAFRVSPRGAAQRVYEAEVRRRVDPALLEQIGPRQYRLRVFPIPASRDEPRRMHLWLTYRTLPTNDGWPLPQLLEARNVFWDDDTKRTVAGEQTDGEYAWSSTTIEMDVPEPRRRVFAVGDAQIVATPLDGDVGLPRGGRNYAVVLDRSYSMHEVEDELDDAFAWLRENVYPRSNVDVYLTAAPTRGAPAQRVDDATSYDVTSEIFYGGQSTTSMMQQAIELAEDADIACPFGKTGIDCYDAVLFFTDRGRMEMESGGALAYDGDAPLWMIHLGGTVAVGYDDAVTEAMQKSAGGVATTPAEAFAHFALAEQTSEAFIGFGGGYRWTLENGTGGATDPIAARQFVRAAIQTQDVSDRDVLQRIHSVATRAKIVTPYSSMIVLVMDRQHQALDIAENQADAFDRRTNTDGTALPQPGDALGLTGTPEPEVWALLLMGLMMLFVMHRRSLNFGVRDPN
ncbi:MAG: TIGR02921 family PEP-CTERM protein [Deltaproteobacteria bacterium]|jgi:putative PEP-CTERM system integral membrane protein